jgi:hypothetical protein
MPLLYSDELMMLVLYVNLLFPQKTGVTVVTNVYPTKPANLRCKRGIVQSSIHRAAVVSSTLVEEIN